MDHDCCPTCTFNVHTEKLIPISPADTLSSHACGSCSAKRIDDVQPNLQLYEYCLGCCFVLLTGCYQKMPHLYGKLF